MKQVEMFFDYACPYCLRAHELLLGLLENRTDLEMVWRPCEAHPRPERYGPHSDLCIQGLFFAEEQGADIFAYHRRMYHAAIREQADIEDIDVVVSLVEDMLDGEALRAALKDGRYLDALNRANDYAYEESGVWAVPVLRCEGRRADAVEDIGLTAAQITAVLG